MENISNEKSILRLVNPEFDFEFMEKVYVLRRATLDKAVQYQTKIKALKDDPASDAKLIAYCIYIMIKDKEPELTEEKVLENIPADIDMLEVLASLGFISPTRIEEAKKVLETLLAKK